MNELYIEFAVFLIENFSSKLNVSSNEFSVTFWRTIFFYITYWPIDDTLSVIFKINYFNFNNSHTHTHIYNIVVSGQI